MTEHHLQQYRLMGVCIPERLHVQDLMSNSTLVSVLAGFGGMLAAKGRENLNFSEYTVRDSQRYYIKRRKDFYLTIHNVVQGLSRKILL